MAYGNKDCEKGYEKGCEKDNEKGCDMKLPNDVTKVSKNGVNQRKRIPL